MSGNVSYLTSELLCSLTICVAAPVEFQITGDLQDVDGGDLSVVHQW